MTGARILTTRCDTLAGWVSLGRRISAYLARASSAPRPTATRRGRRRESGRVGGKRASAPVRARRCEKRRSSGGGAEAAEGAAMPRSTGPPAAYTSARHRRSSEPKPPGDACARV